MSILLRLRGGPWLWIALVLLTLAALPLAAIAFDLAWRYSLFINHYGSQRFQPGVEGDPSGFNHVDDSYFVAVPMVAVFAAGLALTVAVLACARRQPLRIVAGFLLVLVAAAEVGVLRYFRAEGILVPYSVLAI